MAVNKWLLLSNNNVLLTGSPRLKTSFNWDALLKMKNCHVFLIKTRFFLKFDFDFQEVTKFHKLR